MSNAREWLAERADPDPLLFIPATAIAMRDALLAVLDECDELAFGDESGAYPGIWYDALSLASSRIYAAIDKALGVTDE